MFLKSDEYKGFEETRKIISFNHDKYFDRDVLSVSLESPVDLSSYSIKRIDTEFMLIGRYTNKKLLKLNSFPIEVHVYRRDNNNNWTHIAWATLYDEINSANKSEHEVSVFWEKIKRVYLK